MYLTKSNYLCYEILDVKSSTIVNTMKYIFTRFNLSLGSCRRQCYDGSSNMFGKTSGVAVQTKQLQPKFEFTHSYAHSSLSLSLKDPRDRYQWKMLPNQSKS